MSLVIDAFRISQSMELGGDPFVDFSTISSVRRSVSQLSSLSQSASIGFSSYNDVFVYDGNYAYSDKLLSFHSGSGDDHLFLGAKSDQYIGSVNVDLGIGNDRLVLNHLEGNAAQLGGQIHAGEGNDRIEIRGGDFDIGIFANSSFLLTGDNGNDVFVLGGTQINVLGTATGAVLDGGSGIDTLQWNTRYQLTFNGQQSSANPYYFGTGWRQEVTVQNIERLVLAPDVAGREIRFTESDVAQITAGSDFDQSTLGLAAFSGIGHVLILEHASGEVAIDLAGWSLAGVSSDTSTLGYSVFQAGGSLLVVDPFFIDGTLAPQAVFVDRSLGGTLRINDLFASVEPGARFEVTDVSGNALTYVVLDSAQSKIEISPDVEMPTFLELTVTQIGIDGLRDSLRLDVTMADLSFQSNSTLGNQFETVAVGDINGDGIKDLVGAYQDPNGVFVAQTPSSMGLSDIFADGRVQREARLADFDNDGDLDLLSNTYTSSQPGPNVALLFSNDGSGHFTEVESLTSQAIQGYGETILVADFNNDSLLDFYLPYYHRNDPDGSEVAGSRLMINQGGMEFEDQTASWDVLNSNGSLSLKGYGGNWDSAMPEGGQALDFNHDGWVDIYVGNHLFLNQGGAFFDANETLGLPVAFEEGATFFDWNNDSYLDLLVLRPNGGPELYEYNPEDLRFELASVFPSGLTYQEAYGLAVGDLNGDGWEDVYIAGNYTGTPRIFLNQEGIEFVEYRSLLTESVGNWAGPVIDDIDGDGHLDIALGASRGVLVNTSLAAANTVEIELLGPNGELNQQGRVVQLNPEDVGDERVLTRVVDGGTGYMAQRDYSLLFTDSKACVYTADCFLVDYPSGLPVKLSFQAETGKSYQVYSSYGSQAARVLEVGSGISVPFTEEYASINGDDIVAVTSPVADPILTGEGRDRITATPTSLNSLSGLVVDGGLGADVIVFNGKNAYTADGVSLTGGEGNDTILAGTIAGQYNGSLHIEGGVGDDLIETGHIEGAMSADAGLFGGDGNDTIRVLATFADVGVFGNTAFKIEGGAGNDSIELEGRQFNLLGVAINTVDGGSGFDTLVWNGRYDLNRDTNQTGVDATNPVYAQEIGVRNVEMLDLGASGATGKQIALSAADVSAITAGSDFDRSSLAGLGLTGAGGVLFVNLGDASNQLVLNGQWQFRGVTATTAGTFIAMESAGSILLFEGGADTFKVSDGMGEVVSSQTLNALAGTVLTGSQGSDVLVFDGKNAYTTSGITISGGEGNDAIHAGTKTGQYNGSLHIEGGVGDDLIETGHIEGAMSADAGLFGGDGNDTIRVLATFADVGVFGNTAFKIEGGAGNDSIELQGVQFNLLGAAINTVDGGSGFDTLVWNGRYDLNRDTNQIGVDATNPVYAQEIGVRNVEMLDLGASGATGKQIALSTADVSAITAGSDFDRSSLAGLGLTGTGGVLFVELGDASNQLTLNGQWQFRGVTATAAGTFIAMESAGSVLLFNGGVTPAALAGGTVALSSAGSADTIDLAATSLNSLSGLVVDGELGADVIRFDGKNAYTSTGISLLGGEGNDTILAGTKTEQYNGSLHIEGGVGDDLIETGHIEGAMSADAGLFGGDGNDTIRVLATFADVGVFGNTAFKIEGGAGNDSIELQGVQFNLLGALINTVDGGSGFDRLVWNGCYDLNRDTDQTGIDATSPVYAQEIGVRNVELLDLGASGVTGKQIALSAADVSAITAGSDFDRSSLAGLGLTGTGDVLFVELGDASNQLTLNGQWQFSGVTATTAGTFIAMESAGSVLLFNGGVTPTALAGGTVALSSAGTADTIDLAATSLNSLSGLVVDGELGADVIRFDGKNAYTSTGISLLGGEGNDTILAGTKTEQYNGSLHIEGGVGDDLIETGHIEGAMSADAGLFGGDGNDTIRILATFADVGVFGNTAFKIEGGAGNDSIELQGVQFNLLGALINTVDGGSGFDRLVWNGCYDLNRDTDQTGIDATSPVYAQEIGVRNVELLDLGASGATGKQIALSAADVSAITAGSDFDRSSLTGLGLTGAGNVLFVDLGDDSNQLSLNGQWQYEGEITYGMDNYLVYMQDVSVLMIGRWASWL